VGALRHTEVVLQNEPKSRLTSIIPRVWESFWSATANPGMLVEKTKPIGGTEVLVHCAQTNSQNKPVRRALETHVDLDKTKPFRAAEGI
jgi:hypothetical protein